MAAFGSTITHLVRSLAYAITVFIQFVVVIFLGVLVSFFYALPWLLRIGAIVIWFYGGYRLAIMIEKVYTPFSPEIPVMILQFFVVFVQIMALISMLIINGRLIWGALYFTGGLPLWLVLEGIPDALEKWVHADFIFSVLPVALWSMMLLYLTLKGKAVKSGKNFPPTFEKMQGFLGLVMEKTEKIPSSPPPEITSSFISFESFSFDREETT